MRSNCLLWAVRLWWRRRRRGREGYILFRMSLLALFWHALYGERRADGSLRVVGYVPRRPRRRGVPPLLFRGRVRWGDR